MWLRTQTKKQRRRREKRGRKPRPPRRRRKPEQTQTLKVQRKRTIAKPPRAICFLLRYQRERELCEDCNRTREVCELRNPKFLSSNWLNPNEKRFHHYVFVDRKRGKTERERQKLDSIKIVASTQFILDSQGDGRRLLYHIRERSRERRKDIVKHCFYLYKY